MKLETKNYSPVNGLVDFVFHFLSFGDTSVIQSTDGKISCKGISS